MKKIVALLLAIVLLLCGCGQKGADASGTIFCMDTVMDLQIWGSDADEAYTKLAQLLRSLEQEWSANEEESAAAKLDREDAELTQQQAALAQKALALSQRTQGAFEPRIYGLTSLWGFTTGQYRVPTPTQIAEGMQSTRWDLGAVVKGYAGDRAVELMQELEVDRALLNLGGNVQTYGTKADGSAWVIGVRDPQDPNGTVGNLEVTGTCNVITSGGYQRYFEQDGVRYHHIIDPKTGYPADSDLASVTVVCTDGMTGDVLSTALFVMGYEKAVAHWQQHDDFEAVFILKDGTVRVTEGITFTGGSYEVISREN